MANLTTLVTTPIINALINTPKYYNKFRYIQKILIKITLPYIFIVASVGFITNTATIVLLLKTLDARSAKHKWTLIALALSDIIHNTALSIRVLHDASYTKVQQLCIIISFLSQLADILSASFTALFTIQRYTAVRYPLETAIQNQSSPIIMIFLILISSVLFCFGLLFKNRHVGCHPELQLSWFIADALVSFFIPFTLIVVFNIRTVILIRKQAKLFVNDESFRLTRRKVSKARRKESANREINYSNGSCTENIDITLSEVDFNDSLTKKALKSKTSKGSNEISASFESNGNSSSKGTYSRLFARSSTTHSKHMSPAAQSIHVTRMLILVSTCFLVLNAPAHICMIVATIHSRIESPIYTNHVELENFQQTTNLTENQLKHFVFIQNHDNSTQNHDFSQSNDGTFVDDDQILIHLLYLAVLITQLISYASYSINFFLYSYSGMKFRSNLRQYLRKLFKR